MENICAESFNLEFYALLGIKIPNNLQKTGRKFSGNFMKDSVIDSSGDFRRNSLYYIFRQFFQEFSDNILKTLREYSDGYTIKLLITNCSFHTGNIRTLKTVYFKGFCHFMAPGPMALWTHILVSRNFGN